MAERSAVALHWLLVPLVLWGLTRLFPPTGTLRRAATAIRTFVTKKDAEDHARLPVRVPAQRRSPCSTDHAPLDGSASPLSRPYLPALVECLAPVTDTAPRTARVRPYWTAREPVLRWRRRVLVSATHFHLAVDSLDVPTVPAVGGLR
jgi:hypothetical protein